jgi:hypothetical protein
MIISKKDFCAYIEELNADNELSIIDNVLQACMDHNIDPLFVGPLINRSIKEKLEIEFSDINLLKINRNFVIE